MFLDFGMLKESVTILEVAKMLELPLKQNGDTTRCPCPACKDERSLAITASKNSFYCFKARVGGDIIALVAHVHGLTMHKAAEFISQHMSEPQLEPLTYLEEAHEAVQALGVSSEVARSVGIGYAKKGIMRGRIAFPLRLQNGALVGYLGVAPNADVKLPKDLS